jgi:type I restriction enzyme S subunit
MISSLKSYSSYFNSGITWASTLPSSWKTTRCRYLFREVDERSTDATDPHLSMSQKLGLVRSDLVTQRSLVSESYLGARRVVRGDLVLNRLKAHLGVFSLAKERGVVSPDYTVLRPQSLPCVQYYERLLRSDACRHELKIRAKGIVEGFWRLYTDDFYDMKVPLPPPEEQAAIVRFLDYADRRIRRYVLAKQTLIKLLEEQKQAIIHRAVTRGLNPSVRLKPSGVDWLGDVPVGWEIIAVGRLLDLQTGFPFSSSGFTDNESDVPLLRGVNVTPGSLRWNDVVRWPSNDDSVSEFTIREGDVILEAVQ